jgi:hypothetical protein
MLIVKYEPFILSVVVPNVRVFSVIIIPLFIYVQKNV